MPPKTKRSPNTGGNKKKPSARKRPSQTNLLATATTGAQGTTKKNEKSVMMSIDQEPTEQPTLTRKSVAPKEPVMKTMMMPPTVQVAPPVAPGPPKPPPGANPTLLSQNPQIPQNQTPVMAAVIPQPAAATRPAIDPDPNMKKLSRERDVSVDEGESSDKRKKTDVINSWIRLVLMNGVEGLRKEYRDSANEAPLDRATAFLDNPTRNRYHNIPCCDMTRVKLPDDPHYYLHANLVSSGPNPRRFICTQAPLVGTIEDFWKMVIVSGLEYIVMLCELVEKGKPKSAEYFPTKLGDTMKIGKLCTITRESSIDLDKNLSMSTMRISKIGDTAVAMTVKHIHWHNWPDHGVPDNFLSPFRLLTTLKSCVKPIVVHCSAGVGRTGTLVLILIILESLRLPDFLGVPRLLTKLREERYKSIQTEMQYLYVHRCILEYLILKKYEYPKEQYAKFARDFAIVADQCEKA